MGDWHGLWTHMAPRRGLSPSGNLGAGNGTRRLLGKEAPELSNMVRPVQGVPRQAKPHKVQRGMPELPPGALTHQLVSVA